MSSRYPFDPFAVPERPDVTSYADSGKTRASFAQRLARAARAIALFTGISIVLSLALFVPILVSELFRIEAIQLGDKTYSRSGFAGYLTELYLGIAIISVALVCFMTSAAVAGRGLERTHAGFL